MNQVEASYSYEEKEKKYEEFVKGQDLCDFQQSAKWGKVKEFWKNEIVTVENEKGQIIASASILIRKMSIFGNLMYIPRGPVGNIENEEILKQITEKIKEVAKKYKAFGVMIEPNITADNEEFKKIAKKIGYQINSKAVNFEQSIQARYNFRLNLENKTEEEVFSGFASKTRYNVRVAMKNNVKVVEKGKEGLDEFYKLMEETGSRDHFIVRSKDYFEKVLDIFPEEVKILIAYYNDKPIATIAPIMYGKKMWYLYGASGNEERNKMPTYLLQWEAIKIALKNNCTVYDFRGVCMDKNGEDGLFRYKKGFGGDLVELIGEIYLPIKPLKYSLFKFSKMLYIKLRNIKHWGLKK